MSRWPSLRLWVISFVCLAPLRLIADVVARSDRAPTTRAVIAARPLLQSVVGRDPFSVTPPPDRASSVQATAAPSPAPQPVVPQGPPPLNLTFVGRVQAPTGALNILASQGAETFALTPGLVLPSGYQVIAVDSSAVKLTHPLSSEPFTFALPAPPQQEIQ